MTKKIRTSLVVLWLRLFTSNAGGLGSIPSQGTRFHMPQLRPGAAKFKKIIIKEKSHLIKKQKKNA